MKSNYEGLQKNIKNLETPEIEVWKNQYSEKEYTITLENPEFTCVCPKTGLPDFANITIQYKPVKFCVELKSFKMYLLSYRDVGIFHEHAVNKIMEDFVKACKPKWAISRANLIREAEYTQQSAQNIKGGNNG